MASGRSCSGQDLVRNVPITDDVGRASRPWYVPVSAAHAQMRVTPLTLYWPLTRAAPRARPQPSPSWQSTP